jgi:ATP-dependent helicase/nuclease subunit B
LASGVPFEDELLGRLDATPPAWVVTPTRRLARSLSFAVAQARAEAGRRVAETPPIRDIDEWMRQLGERVIRDEANRVLLDRSAEQLVWEQVIGADTRGDAPRELLDTTALAATASEAWSRVCLWGEPPWSGPLVEDAEAFRRWLPAFRERLARDRFVTVAELSWEVAAAVTRGELDDLLPKEALILAFERVEPSLSRFVEALRSRGVQVEESSGPERAEPAAPRLLRAPRRAAEVRAVASRIRTRLLAQPGLRVAVLAPDPKSYGALLERIFEEELDPEGLLRVEGPSARRFDFAEAPHLADYPLVANALDLLHLGLGEVSFELASRILLAATPRLKDPARAALDRASRGKAEAQLRRGRSARLDLAGPESSLRAAATTSGAGKFPSREGSLHAVAEASGAGEFAARLEALCKHLCADQSGHAADGRRGGDLRRSPSGWRHEWIRRLEKLGWPGPIETGTEGLVFRRWRDAMDEFAGLEAVEAAMDEHTALARLHAVCSAKPVQPSSDGLSVQVMSLLDAAGLDFDLVFVLGMTASHFPPPPRPNPLLPVHWQRVQVGMPRASVEGERTLAEAVWARVLRSSGEVWASWASLGDGDEEHTPSALVADLVAEDIEAGEADPWWLAASGDVLREARPDETLPKPQVRRGGSSIISHQSNCPFRAFAAVRLGAERLREVQPQPDAAARGTLVHAALEQAYGTTFGKITSSSDLTGLVDAEIAEHARRAVRTALDGENPTGSLSDREARERKKVAEIFRDAEDLRAGARVWLEELVSSWMRFERDNRTESWEIDSVETGGDATFPLGHETPLTISYRADRIDRLENDALVLIDFKTSGTAKTKALWKGERPDEPQLPLYAAFLLDQGRRVEGLAFANLSARDKSSLDGLAPREMGDKLKPARTKKDESEPEWDDVLGDLRATVDRLARAYLDGDARVMPGSTKICGYCRSQALCRIVESGGAPEEEETEGEE